MESTGFCWVWLFRWIPLDSTGVRQSPVDFLSRKSPDGFCGLCQNMLVSSGLCRTPPGINMPIWPLSHQDIPGFDSGGFREFPAEHVGECTVLRTLGRTFSVAEGSSQPNEVEDFAQKVSFPFVTHIFTHVHHCRYRWGFSFREWRSCTTCISSTWQWSTILRSRRFCFHL